MKSRKLSADSSKALSGSKNEIASGISPLTTAVACLSSLLRKMVRPRAAASSSTDGFLLTVTKMFVTSLMLSMICFFAEPEVAMIFRSYVCLR